MLHFLCLKMRQSIFLLFLLLQCINLSFKPSSAAAAASSTSFSSSPSSYAGAGLMLAGHEHHDLKSTHSRGRRTAAAGTAAGAANYELLENDARFISYQDLLQTAKRFVDPETTFYSELLFDVARNQIIVGARDMLYRMSFDLDLYERSLWETQPDQIALCQAKGQSERLCRNYVRVLLSYGENQLYACGTYAFKPNCSWRQMENLTVTGFDSGVGKCPFNPQSNITSLIASNGKMFVGTATDYSGSDAAIIRTDVQQNSISRNKIIRTKQYNNRWLNNPQFVGSFEAGHFVYFLFRETAVEYCGKVVYSRIARVCKNDAGGDQILKDNWTSFLKARLNCSLPGEYPFYFNEIQGMTYSTDEDLLYATFTTPDNGIYGSAICAFNLTAINAAFEGNFKHQEHIDSAWLSVKPQYRSQFRCESQDQSMRYKHQLESSRYQLMDQPVQPISESPLYYSKLERFQHIALDTVQTKSNDNVHVLYVSTNGNRIKKLSVTPRARPRDRRIQSCLVEVWQLTEPLNTLKTQNTQGGGGGGGDAILNIEYVKVTESLYVGMEQSLIRIPAQRCSRHVSRTSCLNAMDPYCGWNELIERCTPMELVTHMQQYWRQADILECPIMTAPIDGAWSAWSDWYKCKKHGDNPDDGDCMCRARECNNPLPQNGGHHCDGITTEVSNCTVHGGWTEWSAWSACSQTCGTAVKTRRRTCGNPKPAHGGRMCIGQESTEIYCHHLPPCPAPKPQSIDGGWGPWGEWSECSAACGGGFRIRRRDCNDPTPQFGGAECAGCGTDYEVCNAHACGEVKKLSLWTPWLVQYNGTAPEQRADDDDNKTYTERRFRYACKSNTADPSSLRINLYREETRICHGDGSCQRHIGGGENTSEEGENGGDTWGPCSASCGGGIQYRLHDKHRGRHAQNRICNTQPCIAGGLGGGGGFGGGLSNEVIWPHEWSCWTEWSACSVTCGVGIRRRTRKCLGGREKFCNGRAVEEEKCEVKNCEDSIGWDAWSEWSNCDDGIRLRHRKCLIEKPESHECRGSEFEKVPCGGVQMASSSLLTFMTFIVVLIIASNLTTYYLTKRHMMKPVPSLRNNNSSPSTQIYDSYPNQYSSLPTKDIYEVRPKVKRQSSFNMCSPSKNNYSNGTLNRHNMNHNHTPKVLAKTYNDCETGTLKRNSHALNNCRNIDDEKF